MSRSKLEQAMTALLGREGPPKEGYELKGIGYLKGTTAPYEFKYLYKGYLSSTYILEYREQTVRNYLESLSVAKPAKTVDASQQVGGNHYGSQANDPYSWSLAREHDCLQHSAIKYIDRHLVKNGAEDIKKAISVCHRILKEFYPDA